jgi:hypothetical protein
MPDRKACDHAELKGPIIKTRKNNICLQILFMDFGFNDLIQSKLQTDNNSSLPWGRDLK